MSNGFEKVCGEVGHVALNVVDGKYAVEVVSDLVKAEKVINTVIKEQTDLKTVLTKTVTDGIAIAAKIAAVVGEKGTNFTDDAGLVEAIKNYFLTDVEGSLVPEIKKVYGEIKTDVTEPAQ